VIRRGEVYFVELSPTRGKEQAGRRPVLVVSADAINAQPLVVTVVVGTDAANLARDYPTNVRVSKDESGLPLDTVFLCFQIRALDPTTRFTSGIDNPRPAAVISGSRMREVDAALRLVLGL